MINSFAIKVFVIGGICKLLKQSGKVVFAEACCFCNLVKGKIFRAVFINTTLPDCLSSLQIPPITNTLIAKELIMPCCSYPIPIFLSRKQHFSLVSPVFPPFFASSVLSNNVRLRNSAICIFIRKNCRKIPNSCCYR